MFLMREFKKVMKKDIIEIDKDILSQSSLGFECKVKMGEPIGHRK